MLDEKLLQEMMDRYMNKANEVCNKENLLNKKEEEFHLHSLDIPLNKATDKQLNENEFIIMELKTMAVGLSKLASGFNQELASLYTYTNIYLINREKFRRLC